MIAAEVPGMKLYSVKLKEYVPKDHPSDERRSKARCPIRKCRKWNHWTFEGFHLSGCDHVRAFSKDNVIFGAVEGSD